MHARGIADEVIVVDGGSADGTAERAERAGASVLAAGKGRGAQLHEGARRARGEVLVFLHADARLPASARSAISRAVADPGCVGGNFLIGFLPDSWFTRMLEPANHLRRRLTGRFYSDSAIFVRTATYRRLGGFRPWPLMEDYDFSARIAKAGRVAYICNVVVFASARRFQGRELRTVLTWSALQILYWAGASPHFLCRFYPDLRASRPSEFIAAWRSRCERF